MDMTSYDGKGIFTGRLHLCRRAVATANAAVATAVAFTATSTGMFAVITTSVTVTTCPTNPALSFWSMCRQYPSRQKKWTVRGITCPFYAAASRAKEQEEAKVRQKKSDLQDKVDRAREAPPALPDNRNTSPRDPRGLGGRLTLLSGLPNHLPPIHSRRRHF